MLTCYINMLQSTFKARIKSQVEYVLKVTPQTLVIARTMRAFWKQTGVSSPCYRCSVWPRRVRLIDTRHVKSAGHIGLHSDSAGWMYAHTSLRHGSESQGGGGEARLPAALGPRESVRRQHWPGNWNVGVRMWCNTLIFVCVCPVWQ